MSRASTVTAPAEPPLTLAPQWDAELDGLATIIEAVAKWGRNEIAGGAPPKAVAYLLIDAYLLIAKATRREPVTP